MFFYLQLFVINFQDCGLKALLGECSIETMCLLVLVLVRYYMFVMIFGLDRFSLCRFPISIQNTVSNTFHGADSVSDSLSASIFAISLWPFSSVLEMSNSIYQRMWFDQMIKPQSFKSHYINYLYLALDFSVFEMVLFKVRFPKMSTIIRIELLDCFEKIIFSGKLNTVIILRTIHLFLATAFNQLRFNLAIRPTFSSRLIHAPVLHLYLYQSSTWRRAPNKLRFNFWRLLYTFEKFLLECEWEQPFIKTSAPSSSRL